MSQPTIRLFSLGDAGEISVACHPDGVRIEAVTPASGWQVAHRFPDGLLAKRRPRPAVGVTLRNGASHDSTAESELEIGRLDDGRWEIAQRQSRSTVRLDTVDLRCGRVALTWDGRQLTLPPPETAPGWQVQKVEGPLEFDGSWELVIIWVRGDEDVELVVHCSAGEDPSGFGLVEIDERERVAAPCTWA